jgi:transposase
MKKTFRTCDRNQMLLLPPSLMDWLPKRHLVHFILDVVERLDLSQIHASYQGDDRGQPPYEPRMMTALLFYAYCTGVPVPTKSRKEPTRMLPFG